MAAHESTHPPRGTCGFMVASAPDTAATIRSEGR